MSGKNKNGFIAHLPSNIAAFIVAFVMCICAVCFALCASLRCTFLNKAFVMECADKAGYAERAASEAENKLALLEKTSRVPREVYSGIITVEYIRGDFEKQVDVAFAGEGYSSDGSALKAAFLSAFETYAEENGYPMTEEQAKVLDEFADQCVGDCRDCTNASLFLVVFRYASSFNKAIIMPVMIFSACAVVVCAVVLIAARKKRLIRFFAHAFFGAALLSFMPFAATHILKIADGLSIQPVYMYDFLREVIKGFGLNAAFFAAGLALLGVIAAVTDIVLNSHGRTSAGKTRSTTSNKASCC